MPSMEALIRFHSLSTRYNQKLTMSDVSKSIERSNLFLDSVFSFKPIFGIAKNAARKSIIQRGLKIGVDWLSNVSELEGCMDKLQKEYDSLFNKRIEYPSYYTKPFHAYDEGNLSWQAAMEVESAALSVHAHIYTGSLKDLRKDGDYSLRENFHSNMRKMLVDKGVRPKRILDIGCSTGLSTMKLHESFPDAEVIGVDFSPYMLAVARHELATRFPSARGRVSYLHAAGEETTLGAGDVNVVSVCLVSHELPQTAAREIFAEAYRVLPPGGALTLMDMDPTAPAFEKLASNPFAFAAFRSTEPWLHEYISLDLQKVLGDVGFSDISVASNSPRHRTVVALKR